MATATTTTKRQPSTIELPETLLLHPGLRPLLQPCRSDHVSSTPAAKTGAEARDRIRGSLWHLDVRDNGSMNGDNEWVAIVSPDGVGLSHEVWIASAPDSEGGIDEAILRAYTKWRNNDPPSYTEKGLAAIARHLFSLCECKQDFNTDDSYAKHRGYATWHWDCVNDMGFVDRLAHTLQRRAEWAAEEAKVIHHTDLDDASVLARLDTGRVVRVENGNAFYRNRGQPTIVVTGERIQKMAKKGFCYEPTWPPAVGHSLLLTDKGADFAGAAQGKAGK